MQPSHDVWALALMAYEAIARQTTFTMMSDAFNCAYDHQKYPWEQSLEAQPLAWRQSRLRGALLPCLARDAAQRPTAAALLDSIVRLGHATLLAPTNTA